MTDGSGPRRRMPPWAWALGVVSLTALTVAVVQRAPDWVHPPLPPTGAAPAASDDAGRGDLPAGAIARLSSPGHRTGAGGVGLALLPDGRHYVAALPDQRIGVFDLATGTCLRMHAGMRRWRRLSAAQENPLQTVVDEQIWERPLHAALSLDPDGQRVWSFAAGGAARGMEPTGYATARGSGWPPVFRQYAAYVTDLRSGETTFERIAGEPDHVPDDARGVRCLSAVGTTTPFLQWVLPDGARREVCVDARRFGLRSVQAIAEAPRGGQVAAIGVPVEPAAADAADAAPSRPERRVRIIELPHGEPVDGGPVQADDAELAWTDDGRLWIAGDGRARCLDVRSGAQEGRTEATQRVRDLTVLPRYDDVPRTGLVLHRGRTWVVPAAVRARWDDETVLHADLDAVRAVWTDDVRDSDLRVGPHGLDLALRDRLGHVRTVRWSAEDGAPVVAGPERPVLGVRWSPDGTRFALIDVLGRVALHDGTTWEPVWTVEGEADLSRAPSRSLGGALAFTTDGRSLVALAGGDVHLRRLRTADGAAEPLAAPLLGAFEGGSFPLLGTDADTVALCDALVSRAAPTPAPICRGVTLDDGSPLPADASILWRPGGWDWVVAGAPAPPQFGVLVSRPPPSYWPERVAGASVTSEPIGPRVLLRAAGAGTGWSSAVAAEQYAGEDPLDLFHPLRRWSGGAVQRPAPGRPHRVLVFATWMRARLLDARDGTVLWTAPSREGRLRDADWSPDGRRLATVALDGSVLIWDVVELLGD